MEIILCDIGGVLLDVDFDRAINRLSRECCITTKELADRIFKSGLKDEHDAGEISSHEFYRQVIPNDSISFSHFQTVWNDIFTEKLEVVSCITSYHNRLRLCIVSNTDAIHWSFFRKTYKWFSLFDDFGISYQLGCIKPHPEFFVKLQKKLNIGYNASVFIDDSADNVETAKQLGIKAYVFDDIRNLKQFLDTVI